MSAFQRAKLQDVKVPHWTEYFISPRYAAVSEEVRMPRPRDCTYIGAHRRRPLAVKKVYHILRRGGCLDKTRADVHKIPVAGQST